MKETSKEKKAIHSISLIINCPRMKDEMKLKQIKHILEYIKK
jgi:hypothetical protein